VSKSKIHPLPSITLIIDKGDIGSEQKSV